MSIQQTTCPLKIGLDVMLSVYYMCPFIARSGQTHAGWIPVANKADNLLFLTIILL